MSNPPSGTQWTITSGDSLATIVEVGGGLRRLSLGGREVVAGYGEDETCSSGRGQLLMPWPNRIRDGRYEFDGVTQSLPLSEPGRMNASHGLVRWSNWRLVEHTPDAVTVGLRLHPQPGWPGTLDLAVRYDLGPDGLMVTITATNVGSGPAPFGCGAHPYIAIGSAHRDQIELTIPAGELIVVDPDRKLPIETIRVEDDGAFDFRSPRPIGELDLDTSFGDLARDPDGRWSVELGLPADDSRTRVWGNEAFDWVQVFTDKAANDASGERGIAIEPLSCPPDAFNSGAGLVILDPGDTWSGSWGIQTVG